MAQKNYNNVQPYLLTYTMQSQAYHQAQLRVPSLVGPTRVLRCSSRVARPLRALVPDGSGQPSSEGDPKVQDSLIDILNVEIAKAKVKEDIEADLEKRKESLRQIQQEVGAGRGLPRSYGASLQGSDADRPETLLSS